MAPEPIVRAALRVLHVAGYTTRNWTGAADAPASPVPVSSANTCHPLSPPPSVPTSITAPRAGSGAANILAESSHERYPHSG